MTAVPILSTENIPYTIEMSHFPDGDYYVYIKKSGTGDSAPGTLSLGEERYEHLEITDDYIVFGPVALSEKERVIHYLNSPVNLLSEVGQAEVGDEAEEKEFSTSTKTFTFNETNTYFDGIIQPIDSWEPNEQYIISFDYNTYGEDFLFKFYEKKKEQEGRNTINSYFEKTLRSNTLSAHQSIVTSDQNGLKGYLQFLSNNDNEQGKIDIHNLSVVKVTYPTIFLQRASQVNLSDSNVPTVVFTKINPTQYSVRIRNITDEFMLVLSDAYSSRWKVYENKNPKKEEIVAEYFNGALKQGKSENIFFTPENSIGGHEKELPESRHFIANGYANGWRISPADFSGKKEINLILDFSTQRIFIFGLAVSIAACIVTLLLLLFLLKNERKK